MRRVILFLTIIILFLPVPVTAQTALINEILPVLGDNIRAVSQTYSASDLEDYCADDAALYLEYGFDTLNVTEMTFNRSDIRVELYRMRDEAAAFGVFSLLRYRCGAGGGLTRYECTSAFQLQFSRGPFYVNIINDSGEEDDRMNSAMVAAELIDRITGPSFDPGIFFAEDLPEETMRAAVLVRGPLGVSSAIPSLYDFMGGASDYSALIIRNRGNTLASLLFESDEAAGRFITSIDTVNNRKAKGPATDVPVRVISSKQIIITF